MSILPIPHTISLITQCWIAAEQELRKSIELKFSDPDEEFITKMFEGEFSYILHQVSNEGLVAEAFRQDLQQAFPDLRNSSILKAIPEGLFANVTLHNKNVEKITGADLGLAIFRPSFSRSYYSDITLHLGFYGRGLLCQAKVRRRNGKWGVLTPSQIRVYPQRKSYLSLLLYDFDDSRRKLLKPFIWKLCHDVEIADIKQWSKSDNFPETINSEQAFQLLGNNHIGTDDKDTIEQIVIAKKKPALVIIIDWPDDKRPPNQIRIHTYHYNTVEQNQTVKISL